MRLSAFIFLLCCVCIVDGIGQLQVMESMEWKFHRKLYDYRSYGSITLEKVAIPVHTVFVNITLNAFATENGCDVKTVKIFAKQFGIPVVSRNDEVFPNDSSVPREIRNITLKTNNKTSTWIQEGLQEGDLFIMAIFPNPDTRIRQKGLGGDCNYFITIQAKMHHFKEESIRMLLHDQEFSLKATPKSIVGFKLPLDTLSYSLELKGCPDPCPVKVQVRETLSSNMWQTNHTDCVWKKESCNIQKTSVRVNSVNYVTLTMSSMTPSLRLKLLFDICDDIDEPKADPSSLMKQNSSYRFVAALNRETPSEESQGSNFYDRFTILPKKTSLPSKIISIPIPDTFISVMRFYLGSSDTGSSLNILLYSPQIEGVEDAVVYVCISPHRILNTSRCYNGSVMSMNTREQKEPTRILFPYPENGVWYLSLKSLCFPKTHNKSSNLSVACSHYPLVNVTVNLASCVEGKCGKYGTCQRYTSANMLYSACDCHSGWRGYGCNDGSQAFSDAEQKLTVYLLTLSNLGFIPGIIIAVRRGFFVEALVYSYNMFFSIFYHACDSSHIYKLCIMPYNSLSFADFFASLMSFVITLLAMARLSQRLRSFLHMLMALFISLGEVYNRHGLVQNLLPIALGVATVVLSWSFQCYKRKELYPSKKRYFKFILPGLLMAVLGLVLNLALATEENYKFVHSAWHILESLSIVFLLPPGKQCEGQSCSGLSVQSGDVSRPDEDTNLVAEHGVRLCNAGDVSPESGSSPSLTHTSSLRERIGRMISPRTSNRSFVL